LIQLEGYFFAFLEKIAQSNVFQTKDISSFFKKENFTLKRNIKEDLKDKKIKKEVKVETESLTQMVMEDYSDGFSIDVDTPQVKKKSQYFQLIIWIIMKQRLTMKTIII